MTKLLAVLGIVAALLLSGGAVFYVATHPVETGGKGGTSNADSIALDGSLTLGIQGGASVGLNEAASAGICNDASTTLFAILNPNAATSTAVITRLSGQDGTTTVDLLVGTSTTAFVPANGNITSPSLLNAQKVSTSTQFFTASGAIGNDAVGATGSKIVVGPSQYVVGQATSSYSTLAGSSATGVGGITNASNTFSCAYTIHWMR